MPMSVFEKVQRQPMMQSGIGIMVNKNLFSQKVFERFFSVKSAVRIIFQRRDMWTDHFHLETLTRIKHSFQVAIKDPSVTIGKSEYE